MYLRFISTIVVILLFLPVTVHAEKVEKIQAAIYSENLPTMVRERMETTVESIGSQLFDGMNLPISTSNGIVYEKTIETVFDKILTGYSVDSVQIDFDTITVIHVHLIPWDNTIEKIVFDLNLSSVDDKIAEVIKADLGDVESMFSDGLLGLPIAATDWSSGVLKNRVDAYVRHKIPEYGLEFDIEPDSVTKVKAWIFPLNPMIRKIDLQVESKSLPNILLDEHHKNLQDQMNILINVPSKFVTRHRKDFEQIFDEYARTSNKFRPLHLKTSVSINQAENDSIHITAKTESTRFDLHTEFWADLGRPGYSKDDLNVRFDLGRKLSSKDKAQIIVDMKPRNMRWKYSAGYSRFLNQDLTLFTRYNFSDEQVIFGATYDFFRHWRIRYEYNADVATGEGALLYRFNHYLGSEFVVGSHESFVRLIGMF